MTLLALTDVVDSFLTDTMHQSLIDGDRVRDFLLDLRSAMALADTLSDTEETT
jgi:hypothetical protein